MKQSYIFVMLATNYQELFQGEPGHMGEMGAAGLRGIQVSDCAVLNCLDISLYFSC